MTALRWWPLVGLAGLMAVGLAVGTGSTPLDDWFKRIGAEHPLLGRLLYLTDPHLLAAVWGVALVASIIRRRPRLIAVVAALPVVAVVAARMFKRLFGRYRDETLAYPSGHTTLAAVVYGLAVLVVGVTVWTLAVATAVTLLAALGQGVTYHYFTDTIGALFLGTGLLCLAVWLARLDRCQPDCDLDHSSG